MANPYIVQKNPDIQKVLVGLKGASSIAAMHILKEQGFEVIALHLKFSSKVWEELPLAGLLEDRSAELEAICRKQGIEFQSLDISEDFINVFEKELLNKVLAGKVFSPYLLFRGSWVLKRLKKEADLRKISQLATGHVLRVSPDAAGSQLVVMRSREESMDESFLLTGLKSAFLRPFLFPLGHLRQEDIQKYSKAWCDWEANQSEDIPLDYSKLKTFLSKRVGSLHKNKGLLVAPNRQVIAEHEGYHLFSPGQEKGLEAFANDARAVGLGLSSSLRVVGVDPVKAWVVLDEAKSFKRKSMLVGPVDWIQNPGLERSRKIQMSLGNSKELIEVTLKPLADNYIQVHSVAEDGFSETPWVGLECSFYSSKACLGSGEVVSYY